MKFSFREIIGEFSIRHVRPKNVPTLQEFARSITQQLIDGLEQSHNSWKYRRSSKQLSCLVLIWGKKNPQYVEVNSKNRELLTEIGWQLAARGYESAWTHMDTVRPALVIQKP